MATNPVFTTPDGTPTEPQSEVVTNAGMKFASQVNPGPGTPVFNTPDTIRTPVNVPGWTVQNASTGSDQHTVQKN